MKDSQKETQKTHTTGLIIIGGAHLLHDIFSSFLAPLLPLLRDKHQLTYTMCGFLSSAQRLPALSTPIIGIIADKYSLKVLISLAPLLTAISMSLLGLAPNYICLLILLTLMGITNALFHVPAPVLAKSIAGNRIGLAMSIFMIGGQLARTIGPIIITVAVTWWGLEGTWRLIIPGLILSLFTYLSIRSITAKDFTCKKNTKTKESKRSMLKQHTPLLLCVGAIILLQSMLKSSISTFLPVYLTGTRGTTLAYATSILVLVQAFGVAGSFLAGYLSDRFERAKVLLTVSICSPITMLLFLQTTGKLSIILITILGLTVYATTPLFMATINENDSDHPALLNGLFMTINFSTSVLTLPLLGLASDLLSMQTTFTVAAGISFLTIPFINQLGKLKSNKPISGS
jgi:FSR family fosmidomycin resistance protein-like MFS transporter